MRRGASESASFGCFFWVNPLQCAAFPQEVIVKVVAKTDEYTIYQRRDERFAVQNSERSWVNGDAKVAILVEHKLIDVAAPKPAPEPEPAPESEPEPAPEPELEAAPEPVAAEAAEPAAPAEAAEPAAPADEASTAEVPAGADAPADPEAEKESENTPVVRFYYWGRRPLGS
jgi:hypothetical protein